MWETLLFTNISSVIVTDTAQNRSQISIFALLSFHHNLYHGSEHFFQHCNIFWLRWTFRLRLREWDHLAQNSDSASAGLRFVSHNYNILMENLIDTPTEWVRQQKRLLACRADKKLVLFWEKWINKHDPCINSAQRSQPLATTRYFRVDPLHFPCTHFVVFCVWLRLFYCWTKKKCVWRHSSKLST